MAITRATDPLARLAFFSVLKHGTTIMPSRRLNCMKRHGYSRFDLGTWA